VPQPVLSFFTCGHDASRNLVSQDEGKRMSRRHTVERKPNIRMTDAAASNLYNNLLRAGNKIREFPRLQRSVGSL
jgi:hypothetical protein